MLFIRRYLQYLWLRGVHYRRIIDYIGALEGSRHYQYIRGACSEEYSRMCAAMPGLLKEAGFDLVFRNLIIGPLYYRKIYDILRHREDPVMLDRVNETMKGPMAYLLCRVTLVWFLKSFRDCKTEILKVLSRVRWHNNGVKIDTVKNMVEDIDFDCIVMASKFEKIFSRTFSETYQGLCKHNLKPLFLFFGKRYSIESRDNGHIVEIPLQRSIFGRYSPEGKMLLKESISWASNLCAPWIIRRQLISRIRNNFPHYVYLKEIAAEILRRGKARCVLTFTESQLDYRIFLHQAKRLNLPTLLYHPVDGIHPLTYKKYYSDTVMVCNKVQFQNFVNIGYPPERCNIVGSFNFSQLASGPAKAPSDNRHKLHNVLYFTKGTKAIDEGILDELIEKLKSLNADHFLVIKKHPKDSNSFRRFRNGRVLITGKADYGEFVNMSDLIVSQYSTVSRRIIPLRKPIILYTYSDILEYGERAFFQNAKLPNYLKYVQDKQGFHYAIEQLLNMGEPQALSQKLAEDLYGYMDIKCGHRIAKIVGSFIDGK